MSQISGSASTTLSAFFDSQSKGQVAVDRLVAAGVSQDNIRFVPGYESDEPVTDRTEQHGGFFSALANFFMPAEDRYSYAEGLSRGGFLVIVENLSAAHYDKALDILDDEGAIDLDQREQSWRSEGWSGYQAGATEAFSLGAAPDGADAAIGDRQRTTFGKRNLDLGRSRVRSYSWDDDTVVDNSDKTDIEIEDERAELERRRLNGL